MASNPGTEASAEVAYPVTSVSILKPLSNLQRSQDHTLGLRSTTYGRVGVLSPMRINSSHLRNEISAVPDPGNLLGNAASARTHSSQKSMITSLRMARTISYRVSAKALTCDGHCCDRGPA